MVDKEYFLSLFKTKANMDSDGMLSHIQGCITTDMNMDLEREVTDLEIVEAFCQMDPNKAPCLDGMSFLFFKENWDIVGLDMINFYNDIFSGKRKVVEVNDTMIVLIPKVKDPKDMTQNRSISLCEVVYNIISKVLANRLKPLLPMCISHN